MTNQSTISNGRSDTSFGKSLLPDIHVLKTNILNVEDLNKLVPVLTDEFRILKWTVDLHDVDKVLRIESNDISQQEVIELISAAGYCCEELPD